MSLACAALAAACLVAALILEAAVPGSALGRWLAAAGLAFLVLAVLAPYRPPHSRETPGKRDAVTPDRPHFGITRHGLPVHLHVTDHLKGSGFNKRIATGLTAQVGTMRTFWYFNVLSLLSLPATLVLVGVFGAPKSGPLHFFLTFGWIYLITWICQNYIQLVLLPALMVGQNLQNEAADARASKTFEDVEAVRADLITALDRLDEKTEGGIKAVLDAVTALASKQETTVHVQGGTGLSAAQVKQLATAVQASLLEQARRNPGTGGGIRG